MWIVVPQTTSLLISATCLSNLDSRGKMLTVGKCVELDISHVGPSIVGFHTSLQYQKYINNILHVPSNIKNLLIISQFTKDNDIIIEFNSNVFSVKDKTSRKVLLQGGFEK
ncbi:hypothetical protein ACOSQ3_018472 [Xanthoceras sorbifolium]